MWIENIKPGVELESHKGEGLRKLKTSLGYSVRVAYKLTKASLGYDMRDDL